MPRKINVTGGNDNGIERDEDYTAAGNTDNATSGAGYESDKDSSETANTLNSVDAAKGTHDASRQGTPSSGADVQPQRSTVKITLGATANTNSDSAGAVTPAQRMAELVSVRTREDIKAMNIGGTVYSFKAGKVTQVPRYVLCELNRQRVTMPV